MNGNFIHACYGSSDVRLVDDAGDSIKSLERSLNVHTADVHTNTVNQAFHKHTGVASTLAVNTVVGTRTIELVDASAFNANDFIHIDLGTDMPMHLKIISKLGNVLTFDGLMDVVILAGADVDVVVNNMIDAASAGSPSIYIIEPPGDELWHILRLILAMTHSSAGDLGLFGNLAALTNGCLIRVRVSGVYHTFTNWKSNADIKRDFYDVEFDARSGGGGIFGTSARGTFSKLGVAIKLNGANGDRLELVLQDNLSGLTTLRINGQGHVDE